MTLETRPTPPEPTAVEPSRVLVLNDDEQRILMHALTRLAPEREDLGDRHLVQRLHGRIAHGDEYVNPTDELARVTLRKRRLEGEVKRCNIRISRVEEQVLEDLQRDGHKSVGHAATGATLTVTRMLWAKLDVDTDDLTEDDAKAVRATAKAAAGDALIEAGMGDYVRSDFNLNSVSAHFRTLVKAYDDEQAELPEHERRPRAAESFLPEALHGHLVLDDNPTISVRA
jgi:hypothetical protein